jgi:hypothetical protein
MFASKPATMDHIITWDDTCTRTSYRTTTIGEPLQASKQATEDHLRRNLHEHNTEKRQQENLCKQATNQPTKSRSLGKTFARAQCRTKIGEPAALQATKTVNNSLYKMMITWGDTWNRIIQSSSNKNKNTLVKAMRYMYEKP